MLAIFDKPDPLDGPFFEETIYVTPSSARARDAARDRRRASHAPRAALGLRHGPIHAECRVNDGGVFVLEVAARPIGGLCARALRFIATICKRRSASISLEELLLRHALGEVAGVLDAGAARVGRDDDSDSQARRSSARVDGVDEARHVAGIDEVHITAKPDQLLVPLPGGRQLSRIHLRARRRCRARSSARCARRTRGWRSRSIPNSPLLDAGQVHYNLQHG